MFKVQNAFQNRPRLVLPFLSQRNLKEAFLREIFIAVQDPQLTSVYYYFIKVNKVRGSSWWFV